MISSKDILQQGQISRATLNNYIAMGILPRPMVGPPVEADSEAPMMGYFPDDTLKRIDQVRQLKRKGWGMKAIAAELGGQAPSFMAPAEGTLATQTPTGAIAGMSSEAALGQVLSIDDVTHPAYMVNYNFELTWFNEAARTELFRFDTPPPDTQSRNIFKLLDMLGLEHKSATRSLYELYMTIAKNRLTEPVALNIVGRAAPKNLEIAKACFDAAPSLLGRLLIDIPCVLTSADGQPATWNVYAVYFREDMLIVHCPREGVNDGLLEFINRRELLARNLLQKQLPVLTPLAVLLADLQGSTRICSELPPDEYFELINEIWSSMTPIFRKYHGTYGKHVGDGMVYYFFPRPETNHSFNALTCAYEVQQAMRVISGRWKLRKNWTNELHLNIGVHEGTEWLGTVQSGANIEFAVLGDTINHAARLSEFARHGSIWATKALVSRLSGQERALLEFGVTRDNGVGQKQFVASTYAQPSNLVDLNSERYEKLRDIAALPITEIRSIRSTEPSHTNPA